MSPCCVNHFDAGIASGQGHLVVTVVHLQQLIAGTLAANISRRPMFLQDPCYHWITCYGDC